MELETRENRPHLSWLAGAGLLFLGVVFLLGQSVPHMADDLIPIVIFTGIGATFFVIYLLDCQRWWALIPAYVLWAIIGGVMLGEVFSYEGPLHLLHRCEESVIGLYVTTVFALPFIYLYRRNRERRWLLIPPYALWAIGIGAALGEMVAGGGLLPPLYRYGDTIIGLYVVTVFIIPFLYLYVQEPTRWWALLAPVIGAAISGGIFLDALFSSHGPFYALHQHGDEIVGGYITLVLSLPFLAAYARDRGHWWLLIPGGVLASISAGLWIAGLIWMVPVLLIGVGIYLIVRRRPVPSFPKNGPEADRPLAG